MKQLFQAIWQFSFPLSFFWDSNKGWWKKKNANRIDVEQKIMWKMRIRRMSEKPGLEIDSSSSRWTYWRGAKIKWIFKKPDKVFLFHDVFECVKKERKERRTTSVPAHAIHLPKDDSLWPSQQEGSHTSTNLEPVST